MPAAAAVSGGQTGVGTIQNWGQIGDEWIQMCCARPAPLSYVTVKPFFLFTEWSTEVDQTGRAVPHPCAPGRSKVGQKQGKYTRWGTNEENMAKWGTKVNNPLFIY